MVISRETGILILEKQSEQQDLKDIIASREDGFGFLFKQARSERNLSINDVSRELRLDKKIIAALENEDYTQLPASAFVFGYIRNYAKFLKIQPEPLIEYYKKESNDNSLEPKLKIRKGQWTRSRSIILSLIMPLFWLFVLAALVAGGWELWSYISKNHLINSVQQQESILPAIDNYLNNDDSDTLLLPEPDAAYEMPASEEAVEQLSNSEGDQTQTDTSLPAGNTMQAENILQAGSDLSAESSSPGEDDLLAEGSLSAEGSLPAEGSSPAEGSVQPESPIAVNQAVSAESPAVVNDVAVPEDSVSSDFKTNQLVLKFSGSSWISIKDSDNKILSSDLIKSGRVLRLDGKLPYKVFLGDARKVTVSINGNVFDHSSYINEKNVARFKVK